MDLATAENHRSRLKKELDAMNNHTTPLPIAPTFLAIEIDRLNQRIASASSVVGSESEVQIAVENESMMLQLSEEFDLPLGDIASLEIFEARLVTEIGDIARFPQPLPLTYQLTTRVIELLGEEMRKRPKTTLIERKSSSPRSRFYYAEMNKPIDDTIKTVIERNKEDANSHMVLEVLEENKSIKIDDTVKNVARKRFFEATFAANSKPAPADEE